MSLDTLRSKAWMIGTVALSCLSMWLGSVVLVQEDRLAAKNETISKLNGQIDTLKLVMAVQERDAADATFEAMEQGRNIERQDALQASK